MGRLLCISFRFPPETYPLAIRVDNILQHLEGSYEIDAITSAEGAKSGSRVHVHYVSSHVPRRLIRLLRRIRLGKIVKLFLWPDPFVFWVLPAYRKAKQLITERRPDAVIVFMMPYSQGLAGVFLKRAFGIPLIMNLNDSPTCSGQNPSFPTRMHYFLAKKLEDLYVRYADAVIYVSKQGMERVKARNSPAEAGKFNLIRRGAKLPHVVNTGAHEKDGQFHIVYAGGMGGWNAFSEDASPTFARRLSDAWNRFGRYQIAQLDYRGHSPVYIGQAVQRVLNRHPEWIGRIRVDVYGNRFPEETVNRLLKSQRLSDVVTVHGVLSHQEALDRIFNADLLFLALPEHQDGSPDERISSKTYEYLMSDRPILAGLPSGENNEFLVQFDGTYIVPPRDAAGMEQVVEEIAADFFDGQPRRVDRSQVLQSLSVNDRAQAFERIVWRVTSGDGSIHS